jgi:hypothetical protein
MYILLAVFKTSRGLEEFILLQNNACHLSILRDFEDYHLEYYQCYELSKVAKFTDFSMVGRPRDKCPSKPHICLFWQFLKACNSVSFYQNILKFVRLTNIDMLFRVIVIKIQNSVPVLCSF